ncbi:MAG: nicotinate-nucleotide--dimethylbenzimidazole phosphoribosyltransferase [Proteobacteria bacterium]|nr:nicotinate-nucleotide--dimethylbenzimidazole phosphoribosyltransferase [Pseudomonadota bacterium]
MRAAVLPVVHDLDDALRGRIDTKTKPLGSLGRLEGLAFQIGRVLGTLTPTLRKPTMLVCAGDHGAAREGVSAYPPEVTWQMVENFLAGGAAINVFARRAGLDVVVIDAGVDHEFGERTGLIDAKVAAGTASWTRGPAMTHEQCETAVANGARIARERLDAGCNVMGFGEMGIGNTASATLITCVLCGVAPEVATGRGTGLDDAALAHKTSMIADALRAYPVSPDDPWAVLAQYGGFEMATLVGAMLAAAERDALLLIDGFIVTAAFLVAARVAPPIVERAVFSHCSEEPGHALQLLTLGVEPLLRLGLRLGEGTGAALAFPLVEAAAAFLSEMASFSSAGVATRA